MFGTVRFKNLRLTVFSVVCTAVIVAVCLLMLRSGAPDAVELGGGSYPLSAESDGEITAFIHACGFTAGEKISDREITVPKVWNDVYEAYNETQLAQGLSLTQYKGKAARELIYSVADSERYITLLVSGGRIIAAHISSMNGKEYEPLIRKG